MEFRVSTPLGDITARIEVKGGTAAGLEDKLKRPRPLMEKIAEIMRKSFGENFASGGRPAWTPLAPSTVWAKMAAGLPPKTPTGRKPRRLAQARADTGAKTVGAAGILIGNGALRDSLRQKGARGHIERIRDDGMVLEIGTSLWYARFHQEGTRGPYPIPKSSLGAAGRSLRFMGRGGDWMFRKRVMHPGLPPRPFVAVQDDDWVEIGKAIEDFLGA